MAAATGVDNAGNGQVYRAIAYLPNADAARAAFDLVSGEIHASVRGATFEDSRFVREAVGVRANATPDTRNSFWMHGYGAWGTFDGDGNAATLNRNIGGVFFGADLRATDNLVLGILGGYGEADIRVDARASSASTKDFHLGGYLAYGSAGAIQGETEASGLGIRAGIANMWRDVSTTRNVNIPGYVDTLSASYDIGVFQVWGDIGWRFDLGAIGLEPFGSMAFVKVGDSDFLEWGGSGALRANDGSNSQYWTSLLGGRAYLGLPVGSGRFGVTATAAWQYVGGDTDQPLGMAFGAGPEFDISGFPIAGNAAALGLSLTGKIGSRVEVDVGYSGRIGSSVSDHGVRGSAMIRF
jgi:outer membrane autotransporter protein